MPNESIARESNIKYTICCNLNTHSNMHPLASWEVRMRKNCDRGLEIAARGRCHSFLPYGQTLCWSTIFFPSLSLPSSLKITCLNC